MPICLLVPNLISDSTQLWRAAQVLPLMWHSLLLKIIGSPPPAQPHHTLPCLACTNTPIDFFFFFASLWACSVNRPLAMQCWCQVSVAYTGSQRSEATVASEKKKKKTERFKQPRQCAEGRHFNRGQGSFCRLDWRLPVSESSETCGSGGKAYGGSVALPPYQLG